MNATEMGRRSDSLYYDNVSRRELCDRIAHLESDLDAAKNDLSIFSGELVKSKAENAKLRELCEWLLNPYRLGAVTGEGVDKQWCRETYDGGSYRLRELGDASGAMPTKGEPSGTCHADETETFECVCDGIGHYGERVTIHVMECSECGRTYEHVFGDYEHCPHCRRRIEATDG